MDRFYRFLTCSVCFLMLTAMKIVSPAAASEIKQGAMNIIDRNDGYQEWFGRSELREEPNIVGQEFAAPMLLDDLKEQISASRQDPMADLPKVERTQIKERLSPELEFGLAAREIFLQEQADFSDYVPPDNVSYDVFALPFERQSPVLGSASSGFGYRLHPICNEVLFHYGTDFAADAGTEIHAFADGTVAAAGEEEGYGQYLMIDHGSGYMTLYGHCSSIFVSEGDVVQRGDTIASVGQTGRASGPHLHFELMHNGVYLNPEFYLMK